MPTQASQRANRRTDKRRIFVGRVGGIAADVASREMAGLSDDELRGAFVALSQRLVREPETRAKWAELGREWYEDQVRRQTRLMAVFEAPAPKPVAERLRQAGLSQDRVLRTVWRGRSDPKIATLLVEAAGGTLTVIDG